MQAFKNIGGQIKNLVTPTHPPAQPQTAGGSNQLVIIENGTIHAAPGHGGKVWTCVHTPQQDHKLMAIRGIQQIATNSAEFKQAAGQAIANSHRAPLTDERVSFTLQVNDNGIYVKETTANAEWLPLQFTTQTSANAFRTEVYRTAFGIYHACMDRPIATNNNNNNNNRPQNDVDGDDDSFRSAHNHSHVGQRRRNNESQSFHNSDEGDDHSNDDADHGTGSSRNRFIGGNFVLGQPHPQTGDDNRHYYDNRRYYYCCGGHQHHNHPLNNHLRSSHPSSVQSDDESFHSFSDDSFHSATGSESTTSSRASNSNRKGKRKASAHKVTFLNKGIQTDASSSSNLRTHSWVQNSGNDELQQANALLKKRTERIQGLENEIAQLEKLIRKLQAELATVNEYSQNQKTDYARAIEDLKAALERIAELEKENNDLENECNDFAKTQKGLFLEIGRLKSALEALTNNNRNKDQTIKDLNKVLSTSKKSCEELKADLERAKVVNQELELKISGLEARAAQQDNALLQLAHEKNNLNDQLQQANVLLKNRTDTIHALQEEIESLGNTITTLRAALATLDENSQNQKARYAQAIEELKGALERISKLEKENDDLENECNDLADANKALSFKISRLKSVLEALTNNNQNKDQTINDLKKVLSESEKSCEELKAALERAKVVNQELELKISGLEARVAQQDQSLAEARKINLQLATTQQALETAIIDRDQNAQKVKALSQERNDLNDQLQQANVLLKNRTDTINALQAEIESLGNTITTLRAALATLDENSQNQKARYAQAINELNAANARIAQLQIENNKLNQDLSQTRYALLFEIEELRFALGILATENRNKDLTINQLTQDLSKSVQRCEVLSANLVQANMTNAELISSITGLQTLVAQLDKSLKEAQENNEQLLIRIQILLSTLEKLIEENNDLYSQIQQLSTQIKKLTDLVSDRDDMIKYLQRYIDQLLIIIATLEKEIEGLYQHNANWQSLFMQIDAMLDEATAKIRKLLRNNTDLRIENEDLLATKTALLAEIEKLRSSLKTLVEENETKDQKINQFRRDLSEANETCEELTGDLTRAKAANSTMKSQILELKGRVTELEYALEDAQEEVKLKNEMIKSRDKSIVVLENYRRFLREGFDEMEAEVLDAFDLMKHKDADLIIATQKTEAAELALAQHKARTAAQMALVSKIDHESAARIKRAYLAERQMESQAITIATLRQQQHNLQAEIAQIQEILKYNELNIDHMKHNYQIVLEQRREHAEAIEEATRLERLKHKKTLQPGLNGGESRQNLMKELYVATGKRAHQMEIEEFLKKKRENADTEKPDPSTTIPDAEGSATPNLSSPITTPGSLSNLQDRWFDELTSLMMVKFDQLNGIRVLQDDEHSDDVNSEFGSGTDEDYSDEDTPVISKGKEKASSNPNDASSSNRSKDPITAGEAIHLLNTTVDNSLGELKLPKNHQNQLDAETNSALIGIITIFQPHLENEQLPEGLLEATQKEMSSLREASVSRIKKDNEEAQLSADEIQKIAEGHVAVMTIDAINAKIEAYKAAAK